MLYRKKGDFGGGETWILSNFQVFPTKEISTFDLSLGISPSFYWGGDDHTVDG